jgi:hypothetical protein
MAVSYRWTCDRPLSTGCATYACVPRVYRVCTACVPRVYRVHPAADGRAKARA